MSTKTVIGLAPLSDRIIIRRDEPVEKIGVIVLPDSAKEIPARGTVLAVGPGRMNADGTRSGVGLKPGQTVLFAKYAGDDVEHDGETYTMLREPDVMAIIDEE